MNDLRLTDEEIALILDLDEERTYKSAGLQVTTIDVYPLLDAQLAKLSEMKDREAKALQEKDATIAGLHGRIEGFREAVEEAKKHERLGYRAM
jgi:hypothetical protein